MAELYLMASHTFPTGQGIGFNQEQHTGMMNRVIRVPSVANMQDLQPVPITAGSPQEILRSGSSGVINNQLESFSNLIEARSCLKRESMTNDAMILDVPDARFPAFPLGSNIHEHSLSNRKAFQFVNSGTSDTRKGGLGVPMMANLVDLQMKENEANRAMPPFPSLVYPGSDNKPISDIIGDLVFNSKIIIDPEGRVVVTDTGVEMKDLLSIVAEFYLSRNVVKNRKISMPIPYFDRKSFSKGRNNRGGSTGKLEAPIAAPAKSPDMSKPKQSQKRKNGRKNSEERDIFKRNSFHACESLLSILIDNKGEGQTALLSLQKSGHALPDLLNRFSAGIAGTGLALALSVICRVAFGRVPLCSSKLISTGIGIGLVWLSWAVNKLRYTVIHISKNSSKWTAKEDVVMDEVNRSVKEIFFRAATLMTLIMLKFA
ncbi:hypothetical protein MLD38_033048 [Melastoma candidum]|uniref:Uncharacterized protein n=1 Tax=Melastoma candidum TaxID=119954 RepID=A0ACB9M7B8_9MYRT|nr:hypothetical protein MLD38_033048 [Melastoma candidum]